MTEDPYESDIHRWWHLSTPSPELIDALDDGWLSPPGPVLDLGCGLGTEVRFLAERGFDAVGVDISLAAVRGARTAGPARFVQADALDLPFTSGTFAAVLDRGCLHYIGLRQRARFVAEAGRVLAPGGRLLLRACLRYAGVRNDIDEDVLRRSFSGWRFERLEAAEIPSDTRSMESLVARLRID
jgi:SAM-dependent methyltransferase